MGVPLPSIGAASESLSLPVGGGFRQGLQQAQNLAILIAKLF